MRDLIALIPALLASGEPVCGVHGHAFSSAERDLLTAYIPERPKVQAERLPDTIVLESIIAIPQPSLGHPSHVCVHLILLPKQDADLEEIRAKLEDIRLVLELRGLNLFPILARRPLGPRLCYDIMRLGIVLAGKHPVTHTDEMSELSLDIGPIEPIHDAAIPITREWDPFNGTLEEEIRREIEARAYPALYTIPGVNPYILPYLPILHRCEETLDKDQMEKLRTCLYYLFSAFPPTRDTMTEWAKAWKLPPLEPFERLSFKDAMNLRLWLIPAGKDELPVFVWPPMKSFHEGEIHLQKSVKHWDIAGKTLVRHPYPWVVLAWGALTGLIGKDTYIHRHSARLRRDAVACLMRMVTAVEKGADIIVPSDHMQGSIRWNRRHFCYSDQPFALFEGGIKHSLDLNEPVIKKAALDDTGIEHFLKKRGD